VAQAADQQTGDEAVNLLCIEIKFVQGAPDWTVWVTRKHMGVFLRQWKARVNDKQGENMFILHLRQQPDDEETRRYVQLDHILSLEPKN
jgi:hypothetical protein